MEVSKELKRKKDEEAHQIWVGVDPSAKQCKRCLFAAEDTEYTVGAEMAYCDVYPMPEGKPKGVLDDKAECDSFIEDPYGGNSKDNRE